MRGHGRKAAVCKPRRGGLRRNHTRRHLVLDFQLPELQEAPVCCLGHPACSVGRRTQQPRESLLPLA